MLLTRTEMQLELTRTLQQIDRQGVMRSDERRRLHELMIQGAALIPDPNPVGDAVQILANALRIPAILDWLSANITSKGTR